MNILGFVSGLFDSLFNPVTATKTITAAAAAAAGVGDQSLARFDSLLIKLQELIIVPILWVLMAFAVLTFVWGVFEYFIKSSDDPSARSTGWSHILWSLIGFAIILSVYGIIHLVTATIGVQTPF